VGAVVVGGQFRGLAWVHRLCRACAVQCGAKIYAWTLLAVFNRWWGIDVAAASIEVSGPGAGRLAGELQAALAAAVQPGDSVSPVEVERSADLVIAIIGLVFSGVGTARTIWDWWHVRRSKGVKVKILLDDGTQVDLSGVDQEQLEVALGRRAAPGD